MNNPFTLTFGLEPKNYIERKEISDYIINDFSSSNPSSYIYLLTGIRGSGKTVFMYSIANKLKEKADWIVVNVGPKKDIIEAIAAEIYEQGKVKHLFLRNEFSFSFKGFGFSIEGKEPVSNVMSLLKKMLLYLKNKDKKVLVTIDEVDNSQEMKLFVESYAALLGQNLTIRLLMTGLYSNVSKLQNNKSLTFLYRTPKIHIGPLPLISIANKYKELLEVSYEKAIEIAKLTKGYAFAYQVLGHIIYERKEKDVDSLILSTFDEWMAQYVYEKVYLELTLTEKKILSYFKEKEQIKMDELSLHSNKSIKYLSVYRDELIKEGVIFSPSYGYIELALPRFEIFLMSK